jgi:hypothetical protein
MGVARALPKVDLQWHVADFITGFVPDHDAQKIPCGCASCQISCNQLGVVHRSLIAGELFRGVLRSSSVVKGEGIAGHRRNMDQSSGRVGSVTDKGEAANWVAEEPEP